MRPLERMVRLMTHFNIAATLATAAWVLWTGSQIVAGTDTWPAGRAIPTAVNMRPFGQSVALPLAPPPAHPAAADGSAAPCHPEAGSQPAGRPAPDHRMAGLDV